MASIKFSKTMNVAAIDAGIKSLANRGKRFDADVQAIGLAIMAHTESTGDYTKACSLYHALPKGARRAALVAWFLQFSKVTALDPKIAEEKVKIAAGAVFKFAKEKTTDLAGAEGVMWHDCGRKEERPDQVFDVTKACVALLARVKAHADKSTGNTEAVMAALAGLELALNTKHAALVAVDD